MCDFLCLSHLHSGWDKHVPCLQYHRRQWIPMDLRTAQNTWIRFTSPFLEGSRFPMRTFKPWPPTTTTRRQWQVFPLRRPEKKKHNGCSTTISSSYWLPILVRIDICSHQAQGFAKEVVCQLFSAVVRVMKHPLEDNIRRRQGGQTWSSMQTRTCWLG